MRDRISRNRPRVRSGQLLEHRAQPERVQYVHAQSERAKNEKEQSSSLETAASERRSKSLDFIALSSVPRILLNAKRQAPSSAARRSQARGTLSKRARRSCGVLPPTHHPMPSDRKGSALSKTGGPGLSTLSWAAPPPAGKLPQLFAASSLSSRDDVYPAPPGWSSAASTGKATSRSSHAMPRAIFTPRCTLGTTPGGGDSCRGCPQLPQRGIAESSSMLDSLEHSPRSDVISPMTDTSPDVYEAAHPGAYTFAGAAQTRRAKHGHRDFVPSETKLSSMPHSAAHPSATFDGGPRHAHESAYNSRIEALERHVASISERLRSIEALCTRAKLAQAQATPQGGTWNKICSQTRSSLQTQSVGSTPTRRERRGDGRMWKANCTTGAEQLSSKAVSSVLPPFKSRDRTIFSRSKPTKAPSDELLVLEEASPPVPSHISAIPGTKPLTTHQGLMRCEFRLIRDGDDFVGRLDVASQGPVLAIPRSPRPLPALAS